MLIRIIITSAKLFARLRHTLLTIVVRFITAVTNVILFHFTVPQVTTLFQNITNIMTITDNVSVNVLTLLPKDSRPTRWLDSKLCIVNLNPMSMTV